MAPKKTAAPKKVAPKKAASKKEGMIKVIKTSMKAVGSKPSALTKDAVEKHTRAHEELIKGGHKATDEVLRALSQLAKKDQEQVWKQCHSCKC